MRHPVLAAAVLAAVSVLAGCGTGGVDQASLDEGPAPPQQAKLNWNETYGDPGGQLVFKVESLAVDEHGWRATIGVTNDTKERFLVASGTASLDQSFGLMLLPTGDIRELDRLNRAGELPAVRQADLFDPPLPGILEPGASWHGTIAARGSLPGGSWARVVFGTFVAAENPPPGMQDNVVWITDHAHQLRSGPQGAMAAKRGSSASAAKSVSPAAIER
jgi:hypothetical protein